VVFVADATRDVYAPLNSRHNFVVVHNGLNLTRIEKEANRWPRGIARRKLGIDEDQIMVLLLGTVCERKGQHDLVRALARMDKSLHPMFHCFIVGDRPSGIAVNFGAGGSFAKNLEGTNSHYSGGGGYGALLPAADIFVCTSKVESFPRVILEAMAYELPIITTPVYGIKEQVRPGVNGLFYESENAGQLAAAISDLLSDPAAGPPRRKQQIGVGHPTTFEEMIEQYACVFREASLVGSPQGMS